MILFLCTLCTLIIFIAKQCKPAPELTRTSVAIWMYRSLFVYSKVTNWWEEMSLNVTHKCVIGCKSFRRAVTRKNLLKQVSVYFEMQLLRTEGWKRPFLTLQHWVLFSFNYYLVPSLFVPFSCFTVFFFFLLSLTEFVSPSWNCF